MESLFKSLVEVEKGMEAAAIEWVLFLTFERSFRWLKSELSHPARKCGRPWMLSVIFIAHPHPCGMETRWVT